MEKLVFFLTRHLARLKTNGVLTVVYALLTEALFVGYICFATLLTIETLALVYVTVKLSLTIFFSILFFFSFVLALLGRYLDLGFDWNIHKKSPLVWFGLLWFVGTLLISILDFPPLLIPIIIAAFFLIGFLFWKIFFGEEG